MVVVDGRLAVAVRYISAAGPEAEIRQSYTQDSCPR